ncbi:hypothetical protein SCP_0509940 [Sparassis crispa]|uniref:Uncharacterized protein n=1 Tax=Sparassis crispa TaxID=139825 RepID=A0A401GNY6_9APHY|nr:hypothetical protein SCP_0509940 [Sparassis crispa]GBE83935.1 hypothetical protein SCP_0509940 [Sparassis crispa]
MDVKLRRMMPITSVLLSEGTTCFMCLLILNVIGLAVWKNDYYSNPMTMWIGIFTAIMTCRFMLDLRRAANSKDRSCFSQMTTIAFTQPTDSSTTDFDTDSTELRLD